MLIRKIEKFILALILGLVAPMLGLMVFWWGSLSWVPENWVPLFALLGLLAGILVDVVYLRHWVGMAHRLDIKLWMAIYLFYSMGVFGLFMGVPVFNAILSLPAGFVVGGRLASQGADAARVRKEAGRTALFTTVVLAFICAASAFLALLSPSTPNDLKGMLGLPFEVTQGMILGIILIGGTALLAINWGLTVAVVRFTYTFLHPKP